MPTCIVLGVFTDTSLVTLRQVVMLHRPGRLVMERSLRSQEQELLRCSPAVPGWCEDPVRLGQEET